MENVNVGVVDNEALNDETIAAPTSNNNNGQQSPKRPRTQSSEIGESSNTRDAVFTLMDPDLLDCPICSEPLRPPVYQCVNGHYACELCCMRMQNKCPSCSFRIGTIRCRAVEKCLESTFTSCVYILHGCNEKVSYLKKLEHEMTCRYIPLKCPYDHCEYIDEPKSLYKHYAQEHPDSDISTPFTFNTVITLKFDMFVAHILLHEKDENILFALHRSIDLDLGSLVDASCLAPPTMLDMKFAYELSAKVGENVINVKSGSMELSPNPLKRPTKGKCHLFTTDLHEAWGMLNCLELQLVIRKVNDITLTQGN